MEKENKRTLDKSKENTITNANTNIKGFKFYPKFHPKTINFLSKLDSTKQAVKEFFKNKMKEDCKINNTTINEESETTNIDSSNIKLMKIEKKKFTKFCRESIVDKSKLNSIKHKLEELYKRIEEEMNFSKNKKQINPINKPISRENIDWKNCFTNILEQEKNSIMINQNYIPISLNYLGSKLIKIHQFWALLIELNFKNLINEYEKIYDIFKEAFVSVSDYDSFKIFFVHFMKRQNKKGLVEYLSKIMNKDISIIERSFDFFVFSQIDEILTKNRGRTPDRKKNMERNPKCSLSGSKMSVILSNSKKVEDSGNKSNFKEISDNKEIVVKDISETLILEVGKENKEKESVYRGLTKNFENTDFNENMTIEHNLKDSEEINKKINIEKLSKNIELVNNDTIDLDNSDIDLDDNNENRKILLLKETIQHDSSLHELSFRSKGNDSFIKIDENPEQETIKEKVLENIPQENLKNSPKNENNVTLTITKEMNNTTILNENSVCCEFHHFSNNKETIINDPKETLNVDFILQNEYDEKPSVLQGKKRRYRIMGLYETDLPKDNNGQSLFHNGSFLDTYKTSRVTRKSLAKYNISFII